MNIDALMLMVTVNVVVTAITIFLFWKVLKKPGAPEPDSFSENNHKRKK